MPVADVAVIVFCYLIGSIPTGYLIVRWRLGSDLRLAGSGSTGATNVARLLGRRGFAAVFVLDLLKGVAAIGIARAILDGPWTLAVAGAAVVAGHLWPVWLRFHGGKGLATGYGACLVGSPLTGAVAIVLLTVAMALRRPPLLSTMVIIALCPVIAFIVDRNASPLILVMALLVLIGHRRNIAATLSGRERILGDAPPAPRGGTGTKGEWS